MKINKKKIRNPKRYLSEFKENERLRIGIKITEENKEKVEKLGFDSKMIVGEIIVPNSNISKSTYENAEGKCIIRKDLPKEIAERYWEWSWEDRGHNTYTDYKYIPYERYQREYVAPRALEFMIVEDNEKNKWVTSTEIENSQENYEDIKLSINILLSAFGECETINTNMEEPIKTVRAVKWEILRPGKQTKERIRSIIKEKVSQNRESLYIRNLDKLIENSDENIAVGTQEFKGYIVFICGKYAILESLMPNNATYILDKDWEEISKLTKTEVLNNKLHIERIYHYSNWEEKMNKYMKGGEQHGKNKE
ncbi:MAG: hypothetical protein IJH12_04845 [Clostridia bacterium]|nr:hypothetical protein [Clostridia bacterium]